MKAAAALIALAMSTAHAGELQDYIKTRTPAAVAVELRAMAVTHPGWEFFNTLWTHPAEIAPAARALHLDTRADAARFADGMRDALGPRAYVLRSLTAPRFDVDLSTLRTVDWLTVHQALAAHVPMRSDRLIEHADARYRLATRQQLEAIAAATAASRRPWVNETHDCDDFVRDFLGELARNGLGNLAVGFAGTTHYLGGAMLGGHAVAIAVDADLRVWFIEPQTGKLHPPTTAWLGGFTLADRVLLARAYF